MENLAEIEAALDDRHAAARAAFGSRDLAAYRSLFSADLQYRQGDGRVINREQLMRDVEAQFKRLDRVQTSFTREAIAADGAEVSETLFQSARAETSAFGVFRRIWSIERRGRYKWRMEDGHWKIVSVEVLREEVRGSRISIGRRPSAG